MAVHNFGVGSVPVTEGFKQYASLDDLGKNFGSWPGALFGTPFDPLNPWGSIGAAWNFTRDVQRSGSLSQYAWDIVYVIVGIVLIGAGAFVLVGGDVVVKEYVGGAQGAVLSQARSAGAARATAPKPKAVPSKVAKRRIGKAA